MKKLLLTTVFATALAYSPAAFAADFFPGDEGFEVSGDPFNGPVSANIGVSGVGAGTFTDSFFFTIGANGLGSGAVSSSLSGPVGSTTDVDFLSIIFNNGFNDFVVPISFLGTTETAGISNIPIFAGVLNSLSIEYVSRGTGSYGGNLTFTPSGAVPEPMTWMMMILGFAAVGFAMRRRQKQNVQVRYSL
jgi:hypothetical protein